MIRLALCDDNETELNELLSAVNEVSHFISAELDIILFSDSKGLLDAVACGNEFDLFILDVIMPNLKGTDAAREIYKKNPRAKFIFLTSSKEYAIDSYDVNAVDYILKPISPSRLTNYEKMANSLKIEFTHKVMLPDDINIRETDLCVILSNALENAVNAAAMCNQKEMFVNVFFEGEQLYIEIKNSFVGKITFENNMPKTTENNHGCGTRSIVRLIDDAGGIYSFAVEDNMFVFRCSL